MDISNQITDFKRHMTLLNRSQETITSYIHAMQKYLTYFNINPKDITKNETIDYLITLPVFTRRTAIAAIKFYFKHCLNSTKFAKIEYPKTPTYSPEILSHDEVNSLIAFTTNVKHRTIIIMLYTTGMRSMELINLKWDAIDRKTMTIHIKAGKGNKDRIVPLTKTLESQLIKYCASYRLGCFESKNHVFKGQKKSKYTRRSIETFLKKYAIEAGITKKITPHIIRHTTGTHLRSSGVDLANIKDLFGHRHINTTEVYSKFDNLKLIPDLLSQ